MEQKVPGEGKPANSQHRILGGPALYTAQGKGADDENPPAFGDPKMGEERDGDPAGLNDEKQEPAERAAHLQDGGQDECAADNA